MIDWIKEQAEGYFWYYTIMTVLFIGFAIHDLIDYGVTKFYAMVGRCYRKAFRRR